jgi:hypothetical protein
VDRFDQVEGTADGLNKTGHVHVQTFHGDTTDPHFCKYVFDAVVERYGVPNSGVAGAGCVSELLNSCTKPLHLAESSVASANLNGYGE